MVADGLLGHEQPLRDLGVAQSLGHQREDLELARGHARRVLARRGARAPAHVAHAALAQGARDAARRPAARRARCSSASAAALGGLRAGVATGQGRLVGAADGAPTASPARLALALELEPVRLGDRVERDLVGEAGAPAPEIQLAQHPSVAHARAPARASRRSRLDLRVSPASQRASARAPATGARRCSSPVPRGELAAPRRAATTGRGRHGARAGARRP